MVLIVNKKKMIQWLPFFLAICMAISAVHYMRTVAVSLFVEEYYLAIIIDDFGYAADGKDEMMALNIPFTAAVIPGFESSVEDAKWVYDSGNDVILHIPMEPVKGKAKLGPMGVTHDMTADEVKKRVSEGLSEIQYAVGMNNHMGSRIMENGKLVAPVIEVAKENNIFFLDSLTTNKSTAKELAQDINITYLCRDVFLDSTQDMKEIEKNIKKAIKVAKKRGYCIAIGHVGTAGGKVTAQALENMKEEFEKENIRLVTISELIEIRSFYQ